MEKGKIKHRARYNFSYFDNVTSKKKKKRVRLGDCVTGVFHRDNYVLIKEERLAPVVPAGVPPNETPLEGVEILHLFLTEV